MPEFIADIANPDTRAELKKLVDAGLVEVGPVTNIAYCPTAGLRTDVTRSAQKAADSTGRAQLIQYGFEVMMADGDGFTEVTETWVLPDAVRRQAILNNGGSR